MRTTTSLFLAFIALLHSAGQIYHACPVQVHSTYDYENPLNEKWLSAYDVKFYELSLSVSNKSTVISGSATILLEATREMDTMVIQLQDSLQISKVGLALDPVKKEFLELVDYQHTDGAVYIPLGVTINGGSLFYILIEYGGEAGQDRGFFAGITTATDPDYGFDVTYTLSEPLNAKDWFPVKEVLLDKIDSARINLQCDNQLMAGSNGILEQVEPGENNTHIFRWHTAYPMAYYLLSFAVADYRDISFNAALKTEGDSVLVQNYIYDSDATYNTWKEGIAETGPLISTFSKLLTDYPFKEEKYGHSMAPLGGGMEHQTMTTIHNFNFNLVAHELAHQWFGDHITCGNWQDIWINEGFASYMEYIAHQQLRGQASADGWMANAMSIALSATSGSVYVPEESVEDSYRLFDYSLTYKKGATLLHMIRYQLDDDELFFEMLRSYLEQLGSGHALGEDFREVLEGVSGMDFSCFFDQWYYGQGYPIFNVQWYQDGDSLRVHIEQSTTVPAVTPLFKTPFDLEVRFTEGAAVRYRLNQDSQVEDFTIPAEGLVSEVLFDPDKWLLKNASVIQNIPPYMNNGKYIYGPNPVSDKLFIRFLNKTRIDEILVTNLSGQEVLRLKDTDNPVTFNLANLADGPYLLVIESEDQTYTERIVKVSGK